MKNTKDTGLVNYVNFEMNEIHNLSADLYESMIDRENDVVVKVADTIIERLKLIKQAHK